VRVESLLAVKGGAVATIAADAPVSDAVAELARHGIGALVVSGDGEHIEGILSERDIVRALAMPGRSVLTEPVGSIMTAAVATTTPEEEVDSLMTVMTNRRVRHVPVVRDGLLCGIVSIGDVVKSRIDELEKDRKELVEYITAR